MLMGNGGDSYQVAHNDLAVTSSRSGVGWASLGSGIPGRLDCLLDATSGGDGSRCAGGRASLRAAATGSSTALGGGDLVERLVELARHDERVVRLRTRGL